MGCLLFVDDHPLYRDGVSRALAEAMPDLHVVLASSHDDALAQLAVHHDVDLCLADHRLVGADGLVLLEAIGTRYPTIARGLLCSSISSDLAARAKAIGCVACLSKSRDMDALADALALLFQGGSIFDLAEPIGKDLLSQRRQHLLQLAAQGRSNKEIARLMGITERTVKDHWGHIFAQLAVSNRAEAVSRAHQTGLIS